MAAPVEFDPRPWAAAQLEVPTGAPLAEIRDALRRRLADDDFVPPWQVQQAAELLLGSSQDGRGNLARAQARLEEEQRFWVEIDEFAGEFFDLPPEKRRQRWQALLAAGAFSPLLLIRLRALEPGLNVLPLEHDDPDVAELARHVCNLFVLRPASRAALRHSLLRRMKEDVFRWQFAARTLKRRAIAGLMLDFVEDVANRDTRLKREDKAKSKAIAQLAAANDRSEKNRAGSWNWVLILIGIALGLVRGFTEQNRSSRPKYTPPPPPLTIPAEKIPWLGSEEEHQRWLRDRQKWKLEPKTEEELRRRMEEIQRQMDKGKFPPPGKKETPERNASPDRPKSSPP